MTPQPQPEVARDSGLLEAALRVLSALVEKRVADSIDVQRLRAAVESSAASLPADELARLVVERELASRRA
jgi:hypothetical protein